MSAVCPNGHTSQAEDFCDTCGAKIDLENQPEAAAELTPVVLVARTGGDGGRGGAGAAGLPELLGPQHPGRTVLRGVRLRLHDRGPAPGCGPHGRCGRRFSHGAEAGSGGGSIAPAIPLEWVAEVWVDPQWYAVQEAEEPMPSPGLPAVVGLTARSLLIGRVSPSRNIHPDIDCTADTGVSRRHAQLTTDGQRWFVEDLGSSNGTFVGPASGPLPEDPIPVGPRTELDGDDRIYVGAWTRIVVRNATDDEKAAPTA